MNDIADNLEHAILNREWSLDIHWIPRYLTMTLIYYDGHRTAAAATATAAATAAAAAAAAAW